MHLGYVHKEQKNRSWSPVVKIAAIVLLGLGVGLEMCGYLWGQTRLFVLPAFIGLWLFGVWYGRYRVLNGVLGMLMVGGAAFAMHVESLCPRETWMSRMVGPEPGYRTVEIAPVGFANRRVEFRVYDRRATWLVSESICDLTEGPGFPARLHWSRDGSIAAVVMRFPGQEELMYGAAYDFLEHRALIPCRKGDPLMPSNAFSEMVEGHLAKRGGVGQNQEIPDVRVR